MHSETSLVDRSRGRAGRATALLAARTGPLRLRHRARMRTDVAPDLQHPGLLAPVLIGASTLPLLRRAMAAPTTAPEGVVVERHAVPADHGAVPVWTYRPAATPHGAGAVVWAHAGGFVSGCAEGDHDVCSRLAAAVGATVVSVDYRLAPEHPAPAAVDDVAAALAWVHREAAALGVDPARIAVAGHSAGAGLAARAVQLNARDGGPSIVAQVLLYPMLDDRTVARPSPGQGRYVWTPRANRFGWSAFLAGDPTSAPARHLDLAGIPPTWIGVGDLDLFHDEAVAYADRLRSAEVSCELMVVPGMYHGADRACPDAPAMAAFTAAWTDAVRRAVASS